MPFARGFSVHSLKGPFSSLVIFTFFFNNFHAKLYLLRINQETRPLWHASPCPMADAAVREKSADESGCEKFQVFFRDVTCPSGCKIISAGQTSISCHHPKSKINHVPEKNGDGRASFPVTCMAPHGPLPLPVQTQNLLWRFQPRTISRNPHPNQLLLHSLIRHVEPA